MTGILLGLFGLGIVVFIHEAGHFIAAKLSGIEVEAFSIGWGKAILRRTYKGTEYRIGFLPIGGYCKMKGEELFRKALADKAEKMPVEKGSLFSVSPLKRIFTYVAGPAANLLFAMIVLSVIWYAGFTFHTFKNKIVLLSDFPLIFGEESYPADEAGLKSGDTIVRINGKSVNHYADLQEAVAPLAGKSVEFAVIRDGAEQLLTVTPELDRQTGLGRVGVSAWIDPVIASVQENSAAFLAGISSGDRITAIDDQKVENHLEVYSFLSSRPGKVNLTLLRNGETFTTTLIPDYQDDGQPLPGFSFSGIKVRSADFSLAAALVKGSTEAVSTFFLTIKGIRSLFTGADVQEAVSGPIRITWMVGEVAGRGFSEDFSTGITTLFRFLSLISVALCFGNLLPIPALDGGLILLSIVEFFRGTQVSPKTFYRFQMLGVMIILFILIFTTFGDITYLLKE
jgi:regulator of sigma E protease